jgi:hypothetical protein
MRKAPDTKSVSGLLYLSATFAGVAFGALATLAGAAL